MSNQKKSTRHLGQEAEELAAAYLEAKGWLILDRNYSFQKAEVDIVATDRNYIIFVEVKMRQNVRYGQPESAVTPAKELQIRKAAEAWIYERKMETAVSRFDVISIVMPDGQAPAITHFQDAFR